MKVHGRTDFEKKLIEINKKASKKFIKDGITSKQDSTIINTIVHEDLHRKHPKMLEKTVRKKAKQIVKRLSTKKKQRLRARFK